MRGGLVGEGGGCRVDRDGPNNGLGNFPFCTNIFLGVQALVVDRDPTSNNDDMRRVFKLQDASAIVRPDIHLSVGAVMCLW